MKKLIYVALLSFAPMFLFAQIYVTAPSGHTGIGTNAPTQKLDVDGNAVVRGNFLNVGQDAGATAAYVRIGSGRTASGIAAIDCIGSTAYPLYGFRFGYTGAGSSIMFHRGTNPFLIQASEAADVHIRTSAANRMVVKADGKVGIGTTSPGACGSLLDVNGGIAYNGTLCNTSDKRLKKDAKDFNYGLDEVLALSPIYYKYNGKAGTESEETHVGIYAQDLRKVAPELVGEFKYEETEIEVIEDGQEVEVKTSIEKSAETYLNIQESSIKYMLINAIKEQQVQLEEKEAAIQDLKTEVSELKTLVQNALNLSSASQTIEFGTQGELFQNQPNPFSETTRIKYTLSSKAQNASMQITGINGKLLKTIQLDKATNGEVIIKAQELNAGTYFYSLIVDGQILNTKKMILTK